MSTHFLDGPAAGVLLMLRRAPLFLRAVQTARGEWDALDMLDDEPKPREQVYAYVRRTEPTAFHISARPRSRSGWYQSADYALVPEQPPEAVLRDRASWQQWCTARRADLPGGAADPTDLERAKGGRQG